MTYIQVLVYTYIAVKFQLCSSITVRLTESSLYNMFCIERSPKMGFLRFWGRGKDIWWEPPRNAMTTDLRRLVKKIVEML